MKLQPLSRSLVPGVQPATGFPCAKLQKPLPDSGPTAPMNDLGEGKWGDQASAVMQ